MKIEATLNMIKYMFRDERWRVFVSKNGERAKCAKIGIHPWHKDFCADCFLFPYNGNLYLFYETVNRDRKGILGCFVYNGSDWENLGVVMEQPWHLSYPQVFEDNGTVFMIPEQSDLGRGNVSLYRAVDIPMKWEKVKTLIEKPFADSTLLRRDGRYYLACYTIPRHESAELWHSNSLLGPWEKHPQSDNIHQDARYRRCGGSFIEENGTLYRIAQDCHDGYGVRLYKIPVLRINAFEYEEGEPIPFLSEKDYPKEDGKHTYNRVNFNGDVFACYDTKKFVFKPIHEIYKNVISYVGHKLGIIA